MCLYDIQTNTYIIENIGESHIMLETIEMVNNLYNIPDNYRIEIMIDNNKYGIIIPNGNYTIYEFVEYLQKQFENAKIQIMIHYDKTTHKITFRHEKIFNLTFIESTHKHVTLNYLLGFSNTMYKFNNTYSGDECVKLHIFNRIYIRLEENECISKVYNSQFVCLTHMNLNDFNKISIHTINTMLNCREKMSYCFYYYANKQFYKITQKLQFQILCLL